MQHRTHRRATPPGRLWRILVLCMSMLLGPFSLWSIPGQAAMSLLPVDDLATQADTIVIGTVQQQESAWDARHTGIHTDVVLAVERVLAGTPGERLTLRVEGGIVGGMGMRTSNDATFTTAERVLVLLDTSVVPSRLVGLQQGKFTVQDQVATRREETWELDALIEQLRAARR